MERFLHGRVLKLEDPEQSLVRMGEAKEVSV
jgi:hypothetical protein